MDIKITWVRAQIHEQFTRLDLNQVFTLRQKYKLWAIESAGVLKIEFDLNGDNSMKTLLETKRLI